MYDRVYVVTVVSAIISEIRPEGGTWDALGGMADPYAVVRVDGEVAFVTSTEQDNRWPEWNELGEVRLFSSSEFEISIRDEDIADNDTIARIGFQDLGNIIKDGGYSGSTTAEGLEELTFLIEPK